MDGLDALCKERRELQSQLDDLELFEKLVDSNFANKDDYKLTIKIKENDETIEETYNLENAKKFLTNALRECDEKIIKAGGILDEFKKREAEFNNKTPTNSDNATASPSLTDSEVSDKKNPFMKVE